MRSKIIRAAVSGNLLLFLLPKITIGAGTTTAPPVTDGWMRGAKPTGRSGGEYVDYIFGCPGGKDALGCFVDNAYQFSLVAIGIVATFIIIIAGIIYMTSGGDPGRIQKAKQFIKGAFAGVGLLVLAYVLIDFLEEIFG